MKTVLRTAKNTAPFVLGLSLVLSGLAMSKPCPKELSNKTVQRQLASKIEISDYELAHEIQARLFRVPEFKLLLQESQRMGVKVYLFGGTAAAFAHYVRWDLMREKKDPRFQGDRFDYDFTNIYRSTQDLDIVVDGGADKISELQTTLQTKYPYLQGNKDAWEVRSLREKYNGKMALLNNPDFLNQNTDSNSTGMIEITDKPGLIVHDLRDWNNPESQFLQDVSEGKIHYYYSDLHGTTEKAKAGENPLIFSAIRLLIKAVQFELEIRPEDLAKVQEIIKEFNPKAYPKKSYVNGWIEKNGKKLVQNAVNIEFAVNLIEKLGLKPKLINMNGNVETTGSLSWWMNKEPLKTYELGAGNGKTAGELGIDIVAHETGDLLAHESITKAHTGDPNVLSSRAEHAGEAAVFGNGFYTRKGREGAKGSGLTVRLTVNPNAREGTDFFRAGEDYVVFRNKAALRVIPESLSMTTFEFFEFLRNEKLAVSDRAILEKLKRRISNQTYASSDGEIAKVENLVQEELPLVKADKGSQIVIFEWLSSGISDHNKKLKSEALKALSTKKMPDTEFRTVLKIISNSCGYAPCEELLANMTRNIEKNFHIGNRDLLYETVLKFIAGSQIKIENKVNLFAALTETAQIKPIHEALNLFTDLNEAPNMDGILIKAIDRYVSGSDNLHAQALVKIYFSKPGATISMSFLKALVSRRFGSAAVEFIQHIDDFTKYPDIEHTLLGLIKILDADTIADSKALEILAKNIFNKPGMKGNLKILNALIDRRDCLAASLGFSYIEDFTRMPTAGDSIVRLLSAAAGSHSSYTQDLAKVVTRPGMIGNMQVLEGFFKINQFDAVIAGLIKLNDFNNEKGVSGFKVDGKDSDINFFGHLKKVLGNFSAQMTPNLLVLKMIRNLKVDVEYSHFIAANIAKNVLPLVGSATRTKALEVFRARGFDPHSLTSTANFGAGSCDSALTQR